MSEENNILYTCEQHGNEVYFKIKNNPQVPRDYIYSYFPPVKLDDGRTLQEKMWVKITEGTRKGGMGTVENMPEFATDFMLGDKVRFETDDNDITRVLGGGD